MTLGLLGAFGAALAYGIGAVLQAVAARSTATTEGLDPRLMLRLVRSWKYVLGVGLDVAGFVLSIAAVRTLPLFVVQSIVASFLAVTAVVGAIVLKMPLRRADWVGLAVVVSGLALVGLSAAEDSTVDVSEAEQWGVLLATVLVALLAVPLARLRGATGAAALGAVAGLAFGATSVAARMLPGSLALDEILGSVGVLLASPATYALVLAGGLALLTYSTALQRGTVTQATAPLVVGETVLPAAVGLLLLGDEPRPGWGWVAVTGFVLAVAGAVSLSRHGEITTEQLEGPPPDTETTAPTTPTGSPG
jgi:drug/metabolite transporter (DMT)-like permease